MRIRLLASLAVVAALLLSVPVPAQVGTRAYAPEDLHTLSVNDRVRVIENEYADQTRGRRIPDDQLEFYLDQIDSGWTFSRIRRDIAQSLGGNGRDHGDWRPPASGWQAREVVCTSDGSRYRECRTPFYGRARVTEQISRTACREGRTWGQREGLVWVNKGCRARFGEVPDSAWNAGSGRRISCESRDGRYHECAAGFTGRAQLTRQLSSASCIAGRSWGQRGGMVWVDDGCRAEFVDGNGPGPGGPGYGRPQDRDYSVTCASDRSRYTTCAWNPDMGWPRLIEQLSGTVCVEGRTWGYDTRRGLWVDQGCRARFGPR